MLALAACDKTKVASIEPPVAASGMMTADAAGEKSGEAGNAGTLSTSEGGASDVGGAAPVPLEIGGPVQYQPPPGFEDCIHAQVRAHCMDGWCRIPAGCFVMGTRDDEWRHSTSEDRVAVTLTHPFEMQQYEATQGQWEAMGLPNHSTMSFVDIDAEGDARIQKSCTDPQCPVTVVNWFEVAAYANLLSEQHDPKLAPCYTLDECEGALGDGMVCSKPSIRTETVYECEGYRMPTDAEWEYAARAGTTTTFYSGDITEYSSPVCGPDANLELVAWYCYNSGNTSHPVGQLEPNSFGLYDMLGNVVEHGHDHVNVGRLPGGSDPRGDLTEEVQRNYYSGGAQDNSALSRASTRLYAPWGGAGRSIGFRLVRTLFE